MQKPDLLKLGLNPSADKSKIKQASAEISALLESICGLQADRRGLIGLSDVDVDLARTAREHHMKRTLDNLVMQVLGFRYIFDVCGVDCCRAIETS